MPNLTIMLYFSDVGYSPHNSRIPTPNLDYLSHHGVKLTSYYTHALCTPSRAAFITGRYHVNTGLNYVLSPGTPAGLPDDITTIPQFLKDGASYGTAMVGKWYVTFIFFSI